MIIEIDSRDVNSRTIHTSEGEVQVYTQRGYIHLPNQKYPVQINIPVEDPSQPFIEGAYNLSDHSFYVDRYRNLKLRRFLDLELID